MKAGYLIAGIGGTIFGSAITWFIAKGYFENYYDKREADNRKELEEYFKSKYEKSPDEDSEKTKEEPKESKPEKPKVHANPTSKEALQDVYIKHLKENGYVKPEESPVVKKKERDPEVYIELVMNEDEYLRDPDYTDTRLTYWANEVMTDERDEIVGDYSDMIGEGWKDVVEKEGVAYVVNHDDRILYEITEELDNYDPQEHPSRVVL